MNLSEILEKAKEFRDETRKKTKPAKEMLEYIGQALKAVYYDVPKEIIKELSKDEREEHEGQDAVQQTDQNSRGKEELEGKSVRGREGEDSQVRGPEDAGPLRRARKKKKFQSPPQVRPTRK